MHYYTCTTYRLNESNNGISKHIIVYYIRPYHIISRPNKTHTMQPCTKFFLLKLSCMTHLLEAQLCDSPVRSSAVWLTC